MLFLGSPGTGKTSMARTVAKMLKHLGVLKKGQLVEVGARPVCESARARARAWGG
jgi:AAA+ superfamily predicted ATPase